MTEPTEVMDTQDDNESSSSTSTSEAEVASSSSSSSSSTTDDLFVQADKEALRKLRLQDEARRARLQAERARQLKEFERSDLAAKDRLEALLRQTENWAYTVRSQPGEAPITPARSAKSSKGKEPESITSPNRRMRRTEKEEDTELLSDARAHESGAVRLTVTPGYIKFGTMRDYQLHGLNWLIKLYDSALNGILADEMGLGKTLQTISMLGYLKHMRGVERPHLVIVPKSTLGNWVREFNRWCPSMRVFKFHGNKEERLHMTSVTLPARQYDVIVTSYEMCTIEKAALRKIDYSYVVIDEAHRIKNENSLLSVVVRTFTTQARLLITGTPLQNNLHELWALLNFLLPDVFASSEDFDRWFDIEAAEDQASVVAKLHRVLRPFLLRRLKAEVEKSLPPKKELKLYIGMSDMQMEWYKRILMKDLVAINGADTSKGSRMRLLNIVMQLRKCCNHPYLFNGAEPGPPYTNGEHLVYNSGKMVLLDKLLPRLRAQGSRVLIFSQMTRVLDILEDYLVLRDYQYCRIDGSTSGDSREEQLDEYNAPNSEKFVFLLSTRAGGLGINLYTADIVILYDSDWNPQMDLQAQDRAHRIGQKKEVKIYRFCTEGTVEEKIIERAEAKLHLDALVIQQGRLAEQQKNASRDELLHMVKFGADQIFEAKGSSITDADVDAILAAGEKKTAELSEKLKNTTKENLHHFTMSGEFGSVYDFQGRNYKSDRKEDIAMGWIAPKKRERKMNYAVDDYYRDMLKAPSQPKKPKLPRPPKQPVIHDFQLYPARLHQLFKKETKAYRALLEHRRGLKSEPEPGTEPDFGDLTEKERKEVDTLLQRGFPEWSRREFYAFLRGCEKYGRKQFRRIATEVESKDEDEVRQYSKAFWKEYRSVFSEDDANRITKNIEKGEAKIQRISHNSDLLEAKVAMYKNPMREMKIIYGNKTPKAWTEEEDVFLVCKTHDLGYGSWEELKAEIRRAWQFRFDWFFKSRTPVELQRRCDTLIRLIEKELETSAATSSSSNGKKQLTITGLAKRRHNTNESASASKKAKL